MRTLIIYHGDGSKTVLEGQGAKISTGKDRGDERREKVNFHNNMLRACEQAEASGAATFSRREADHYKKVHGAAAECGGDLPAVGTTRLGF